MIGHMRSASLVLQGTLATDNRVEEAGVVAQVKAKSPQTTA
jgi:hypothetical protein